MGALAGLASIIHGSMGRMVDPFSLVGLELSVIAAAVLGGAHLTGGYGTVSGTLLGAALIILAQKSLIIIGIASTGNSDLRKLQKRYVRKEPGNRRLICF